MSLPQQRTKAATLPAQLNVNPSTSGSSAHGTSTFYAGLSARHTVSTASNFSLTGAVPKATSQVNNNSKSSEKSEVKLKKRHIFLSSHSSDSNSGSGSNNHRVTNVKNQAEKKAGKIGAVPVEYWISSVGRWTESGQISVSKNRTKLYL